MKESDCYKETLETIYEETKYTKNKEVFVSAHIYLESGLSFSDGEYTIGISTGKNCIDIKDTDLISECIEYYLEECIGKIPEEENIIIDMVDDGEQEDVFWNRYLTIKKVSILTLEEIKGEK